MQRHPRWPDFDFDAGQTHYCLVCIAVVIESIFFFSPAMAMPDLSELSTAELLEEVQRRLSCQEKPEKHLILIGARFTCQALTSEWEKSGLASQQSCM